MVLNEDRPSCSIGIKNSQISQSQVAENINIINITSYTSNPEEEKLTSKRQNETNEVSNKRIRKNSCGIELESDKNEILQQLKKLQQAYEKEDFLLDINKTFYADIEDVFPEMVQVPFLDENIVTTKEQYSPSKESTQTLCAKQAAEKLNFKDVLTKCMQDKVLNLIGLPGQGKSTFCKRAVKYFNDDENFLCIMVELKNLNFDLPDDKLTLQQLLIDNIFVHLKPKECTSAFDWILKNDDKVLLIFDGYDQVSWSTEGLLTENAPQRNCYQPQLVWNLISNVLFKKYLPRSQIIFTSRPHTIKSLPKSIQKKFTVQLIDLSFNNMKKLFNVFAGRKATKVWNMLLTKAPQLVSLCGSPLILQLVIMACTSYTSSIGTIKTMTRLFSAVLDKLNASSHSKCMDIQNILPLLTKLAFFATKSGNVRMTKEDLERVGLDVSLIRHLVISQQTGGFCHLFEGKEIFYFIHQTFQEYLAALHIAKYMLHEEFTQFLDKDIFSPRWTVVGRFLYGIVFDMLKNKVNQDQKIKLLKKKLMQEMYSFTRTYRCDESFNPGKFVEISSVIRECADEDITEATARYFPTEAVFKNTSFSSSDAHAVSLVLRKVKTRIQYFGLGGCNLTSQTFKFFVTAIKDMIGSIDRLNISFNILSSHDLEDGVLVILHKINDRLYMRKCFGDMKRSTSKEEAGKIQAKLNSLEHSTLEVLTSYADDRIHVTLKKTSLK